MPAFATRTREFRADVRSRRPRSRLSGWTHFGLILGLGASTTALCLSLLREPAWREWAAFPAAFLAANLVE